MWIGFLTSERMRVKEEVYRRAILDPLAQPVVYFFEDLAEVIFVAPLRVVFLKPAHVTDPPDVVADAAGFFIGPVQLLTGNLLTQLYAFQHGTVAESAAAHIVHLGHAGSLVEMIQGIHEVV